MKIVRVKYDNRYTSNREYCFYTDIELKTGRKYYITADENIIYNTPVIVMGYDEVAPEGVALREITDAIPFIDELKEGTHE